MKIKLKSDAVEAYKSKIDFIDLHGYEKMSPWQRKFLASIQLQLSKDAALSKKQMDQIDNMFEIATRDI